MQCYHKDYFKIKWEIYVYLNWTLRKTYWRKHEINDECQIHIFSPQEDISI